LLFWPPDVHFDSHSSDRACWCKYFYCKRKVQIKLLVQKVNAKPSLKIVVTCWRTRDAGTLRKSGLNVSLAKWQVVLNCTKWKKTQVTSKSVGVCIKILRCIVIPKSIIRSSILVSLSRHYDSNQVSTSTTSYDVFIVQDPSEGPLTKHVHLTSALIIRNLARYSSLGRR